MTAFDRFGPTNYRVRLVYFVEKDQGSRVSEPAGVEGPYRARRCQSAGRRIGGVLDLAFEG
jgi:hypothetical protein